MKLEEPRTGTLTDGYKISLEIVAVASEPVGPPVTRFRQVGMPVDPEEPTPFIRIWRPDGASIKPGLYEYHTMGETYSVENLGAGVWFVLGCIAVAPDTRAA
jgi:hypothetical protein